MWSVIVFLIFLVLKLVHVIDWSWWLVTAPLWIGFIVTVLLYVIFGSMSQMFHNKMFK